MRCFVSLAVVLMSSTLALAVAADSKSVIVAPLSEANEQQQADWISRSLHQSLVDDVAAIPGVTVLNASKPANPSDAQLIIRTTIQRGNNGDLRITGRVEETATGKTVGGFKAGGPERELFAIQDSIADQVGAVLGAGQQPPPAVARQQPQQNQQQPAMIANGVFEGSDLQRALMDRDYVRRAAARTSVPDPGLYGSGGGYGYQQPLYPYTVGLNGYYPGYGGHPGWGWGGGWWGWGGTTIIINKKHGHHGGWNGGGGGGWHGGGGGSGGNFANSQQLRSAAVFGHGFSGQSNMVVSPSSGQARVGGGHGGGRR